MTTKNKTPKTKPAKAESAEPAKFEAAESAKTAKPAKPAKATPVKPLSMLEAAAQVLDGAKEPMTCPALIDAMSSRKLWVSPNGKTPEATLSAALQREIKVKGAESRFKKTGRGLFAKNG